MFPVTSDTLVGLYASKRGQEADLHDTRCRIGRALALLRVTLDLPLAEITADVGFGVHWGPQIIEGLENGTLWNELAARRLYDYYTFRLPAADIAQEIAAA